MMVIFFVGIGASMIAVGLVQTPLQLGAALLSIGLFASIYHPVGTAMIVSYADRLGREMGLNGVWGNLGVASSALVTGVIGQYLGWRWAFIVPGHRHHPDRRRPLREPWFTRTAPASSRRRRRRGWPSRTCGG